MAVRGSTPPTSHANGSAPDTTCTSSRGRPFPRWIALSRVHEIHNDNVFGQAYPDFFDPESPFSLLKPLSLWELGVPRASASSRKCRPSACASCCAGAKLQERHTASTWSSTTSLSRLGPAGYPRNRRSRGFGDSPPPPHRPRGRFRDRRRGSRRKSSGRSTSRSSCSSRSLPASTASSPSARPRASEIERYFGIPQKRCPGGLQRHRRRTLPPVTEVEVIPDSDLLFVGRTEDRKKGIGTMLEGLSHAARKRVTLKIVDGRIPRGRAGAEA